VCTFGVVNESKQPTLMVEAMAVLAASGLGARLVFVGPAATAERERLSTLAAERGLEGRVQFTGWVSDDGYQQWLSRATVALQLRAFSNGETSASVGDCLRYGVATVVTKLGSAADLPEDCVARLDPDAEATQLAQAVASLLADPAERHRMGEAAQAYVARHGFGQSAERLLGLIGLIGSTPAGDGSSAPAKSAPHRYASPGPAGPPH
jgi:glycosyltransferase involved in cell wall biosynthesis